MAKIKENAGNTANAELMDRLRTMELELAEAKGITSTKERPLLPEKEDETSPTTKNKTLHPMQDMNPTSCPLKTEAPTGVLSAKITEWCKQLSGKPGSTKAKKIEAAVESFQNYYTKNMTAADKVNLPEVAHAWGLPVKLAGGMKEPDIVKVLAVVSVIAD